ncbi:MAG: cation-transporting P-type ATPase [Planctomycetota bacterium]|nr:MAG: cation-transporting P-type ATPase [Planctomycetota bacterium]
MSDSDPSQQAPPPTWHAMDEAATLQSLGVNRDGLTTRDAAQRLAEHGHNRLPTKHRTGPFLRFISHFHNVLIYILMVAGVVTGAMAFLGDPEKSTSLLVDSIVIWAVVILNALIGFIQEGKAEKALDAIRGMLSAEARVRRDGAEITVSAEELVPGDVVLLRAGEKIPADLRLLATRDLRIEEAILTGESVASEKDIAAVASDAVLGDRTCMAFSGTLVTFGTGEGVVVGSGEHTELGRINDMLGNVEEITTPLLKQMNTFGHLLSVAILGVAALAFGYGWLLMGMDLGEIFIASVALAIAAIPEGLPAIMTITLAIGVRRMAQRNAIIRALPAVDTLGSVTVICSDKTGTLTRNEMTVTDLIVDQDAYQLAGSGYEPRGEVRRDGEVVDVTTAACLQRLLGCGMLCTESHLRREEGRYRLEGAPTDGAVLVAAMKAGLDREQLRQDFPLIDSIPFSSEHKFSARLVGREGGGARICVMGAPDRLLERCSQQHSANGPKPLDQAFWLERLEDKAGRGLRVLGIAYKDLDHQPSSLHMDDVEGDLVLAGLVGIIDPPRDEAIAAVKECHSAGIRVIMITGDHKLTAQAIAGQIGIDNAEVHTGGELEAAGDEEIRQWVRGCNVYARVSPEHKLRLVTALQANGAVAAMTGDGVNDAPAIKRADVGVGMGITGTEVTKEAADMVLTDDNFASITAAVREGRTVYDNLRKAILFILPSNGGEALALLAAIALGRSLPLTAGQILWVNMITAVTLALALAFEPPEKDIMQRPPRPTNASMLDRYFLFRITYVSLIIGLGTFAMFVMARAWDYELSHAQSMAVNTLVLFEIAYLFNTRFITGSTLSLRGLLGSRLVLGAVAIVVLAQMLFTYAPFMHWLFASASLSAQDWLLCLLPAVALFFIVEIEKAITRSVRGGR